jgi:tetratricopeptide (TPR) repeat protein
MTTMRKGWGAALGLALLSTAAVAGEPAATGAFSWSTKSEEARGKLARLQQRIESFEFGPANVALAREIVAADPGFAMGHYYLSATLPTDEGQAALDEAVALAKKASDGERRFIEALAPIRNVQTLKDARVSAAVAELEALARDYPDERLVQVILGQLYQARGEAGKAKQAFLRCEEIGPSSPRARAFLANDDLLHGSYAKARATFEAIEASLPRGSAPFTIRYGIAFSYLYEGRTDDALHSLRTFLDEYRAAGLNQGFPEVFIWNSLARINLENGRLEEAMKDYEQGFASVPGSSLPEDQKTIWKGRLVHGRCRVLARMGRHDEAWAEAQKVKAMIEAGGEEGEQFWPAWHYLAGYLKLEAGDPEAALAHLQQANPDDPFHTLLLARAYERTGHEEKARKAYQRILASTTNGLERTLAYPEAKSKLAS